MTPSFERQVEELAAELRQAGASQVTTYYDTGSRRLVSQDRDATGMLVALGADAEDDVEGVVDAVQSLDGRGGFEAAITGEFTLDDDFSTLAEEDLANGELGFGLPAALIVLLIVFGSVVGGLIPLLMAIVAIVVGLALTALIGQAWPLSVFATNMLTGMGLALGIDYSLFVLSRYREERLHGREKPDAIAAVGGTASRAVLFSGIAFTLAMIGPSARAEHDHAKPRRRRHSRGTRLGGGGADAPAGPPRSARRPRQRAADPVLRARGRPRAEPVLVSNGARCDEAAAGEPRARHRRPARHGRARAFPELRRGRCEHVAGPARGKAGLSGPERRVPRRDDRPGGDRDRRRGHLAGGDDRNRAAARATGGR